MICPYRIEKEYHYAGRQPTLIGETERYAECQMDECPFYDKSLILPCARCVSDLDFYTHGG